MSKYEAIKAATNAYIRTNGRQEITGAILNAVMIATIDSLGKYYQFVGNAVPETDPGAIDQNIAYLASTPGTYTHLGGFTITPGEFAVIKFDGEWKKEVVIVIPTRVSQLFNDAGFITNAVADLVNYYTKGETYTKDEVTSILGNYYDKDEVDSIVSALTRQSYVVAWDGTAEPVVGDIPAGVSVTWGGNPYVGTLPASASTTNKIYLVSNGAGYDEYITTDNSGYAWVNIGTTSLDLSGYATKAELTQLEQEVNGGTETQTIDGTTLGSFENGAIGSSGDINTSTSYKHLTLANDGYTRVTGHGSNYKNLPILAFYNGTPSSATLISSVPEGSTNYTDKTFDESVPAGTAYIVVCYTTNSPATPATIYLEKVVSTTGLTQRVGNLENDMEAVNETLATIPDIEDEISDLGDDVQEVAGDLEHLVGEYTPAGDVQADWGEVENGKYWNLDGNDKAALVSSSGYKARPTLYPCVPGQTMKITTPEEKSSTAAAYSGYDNDGNPAYNSGNLARQNWSQATSVVANLDGTYTYTFKLGDDVTQVGLYYSGDTPYTILFEQDAVTIYSQALDEHIEQLVGESNSAHYYLKGNSNIVYSPSKKLGIIAAGQSNIDGRNSYSDLPAGFVNPNAKVRFCNNTNGTFADFQVTDGGEGNDWSFDAIVYDALTNPSYGNQSEIYVMKKSMGGTSIDPDGATNYHWTADYEFLSSETYSLLRTFEKTIRKAKELQGENFEIKAMLWHQGEGDSASQEVADRYYDNLRNMLAYVRGVVGNPRLYVFCGNLSLNALNVGYKAVINAAYARLASEDPYLKVVDMSNAAMEDAYHFNYEWSIYFGQKVYDLMIDAGIITGTKINPSEPS